MLKTANDVKQINAKYYTTHFIIDVSQPIITLTGDSATGKTFFFTACQETFREIYKMLLLTYADKEDAITRIQETSNAICVLDRYDMYSSDALDKVIMSNRSNKYVILGRYPRCLRLSREAKKQLIFTEPNIIHTSDIGSDTLDELIKHPDTL